MIDTTSRPDVDLGPTITAAQSRCRFDLAVMLDSAPRIALPELHRAQTRWERVRAWLREFWENL